jgi:ketosteroid isomerase-like protein
MVRAMRLSSTQVLLLLLFVWPAIGYGEDRRASTAEAVPALKSLMSEFTAAYETRNIDALMKTLADSDDLTLFLPNPFAPLLIEGRSGAKALIGTFFDSLPATAVVRMTTHEDVYEVYGDLAVNYNYTNIYLYVGGMSQKFIARTTNIFRKSDGHWKIVHIHGSPLPRESTYLTYTGK